MEKAAKAVEFKWIDTVGEVPVLLRSLEMLVPPGEIRTKEREIWRPASLSAIAQAGWIYQLRKEAQQSTSVDEFIRTCRLLLKAIEDSELKRQFSAHRDTMR